MASMQWMLTNYFNNVLVFVPILYLFWLTLKNIEKLPSTVFARVQFFFSIFFNNFDRTSQCLKYQWNTIRTQNWFNHKIKSFSGTTPSLRFVLTSSIQYT